MNTSRMATADEVREIMRSVELPGDPGALDASKPLHLQGVDSLDMLNVFFKLEETYQVEISQESLESKGWDTIDRIVSNLNELLS